MLDPRFIREHSEVVKANTAERNMNPDLVDQWLDIDSQRLEVLAAIEDLNREQNQLAELGKQGKDIESLRSRGQELKQSQKHRQTEFVALDQQWQDLILQIPNLHLADVPKGKGEDENVVVRKVGEVPKFDFTPLAHDELAKKLDLIDFDSGAKVTGSQFYYLKNEATMLEFALIQFGIEMLVKKGFTPVSTPDLAKSRFYLGTGYAPRGDEAQTYEIAGEDLGLIATAEVTMAGMHADEILELNKLPLRYAAVSHCFRREGGAYGKYSRGLYRVHQFTKLEMFAYATSEQSEAIHQEMLACEEEILQALQIPYQVLEMCSGDLGAMAAKKYDLEAWMPGRNAYGEVTSTSNVTDFQARNLNIRYRNEEGETKYAHMLNGTAIAVSRTLVAIMENYQQADGSIKVPEVLQKYLGKEVIKR